MCQVYQINSEPNFFNNLGLFLLLNHMQMRYRVSPDRRPSPGSFAMPFARKCNKLFLCKFGLSTTCSSVAGSAKCVSASTSVPRFSENKWNFLLKLFLFLQLYNPKHFVAILKILFCSTRADNPEAINYQLIHFGKFTKTLKRRNSFSFLSLVIILRYQ